MPSIVVSNIAQPEAIHAVDKVNRGCAITKPTLIDVPGFKIKTTFIAYASPDSTYAVTRKLFDAATREILIGIYDFSATYMKELVLNAMQRGVKVTLMLDIDSKKEQDVLDELIQFGCNGVPAPSCASQHTSYFPSCHEKFIIIDREWVLVQSGNYSTASIPFNEIDGGDPDNFRKGNRDMGVALKSKPLAKFFTSILNADIKLELNSAGAESLRRRNLLPMLVEPLPKNIPDKLFPSKTFKATKEINVTPVLSPDNYMEVITKLLSNAKKSILIENQYIKSKQSEVAKLLEAIKEAKAANPDLDVRIVLGKLFDRKAEEAELENVENMKAKYGLKIGENIRYINTKQFVHCHNKLILIDGVISVISSQNWSDPAVSRNREAGLVIEYKELTKYYTAIFESDWKSAFKAVPVSDPEFVQPEALRSGEFIEVVMADYEEI